MYCFCYLIVVVVVVIMFLILFLLPSARLPTAIITAAMKMLAGDDAGKKCRTPEIMADAAYVVLTRDSRSRTGEFLIDEDVLRDVGVTDFEEYSFVPGTAS